MPKAFISYSHRQAVWVWGRLKPVLEAAGVEVLIDGERFEAGKGVIGQMDGAQDAAERHLLVLSREYVQSAYCLHELRNAVQRDPRFEQGIVIPLRLDDGPLPAEIAEPDPLIVDMRDETTHAWAALLAACQAERPRRRRAAPFPA